jgi:hypothetical protein
MGLFGFITGLFTASKVHEAIDKDHDDSFIEDAFETDISRSAGDLVGGIVDSLFDFDDEDDDE